MSIKLVTTVVAETEEIAQKIRDKFTEVVEESREIIHDLSHKIEEHIPGLQHQVDAGLDQAKAVADKAAEEAAAIAANVGNRTGGVTTDVTAPGGVEGLSGPQPSVEVNGTVSTGVPVTEGSLVAEGAVEDPSS